MANFEVFSIDLVALERTVGSRDAGLLNVIATPDDPPELREAMRSLFVTGTRPFQGDAYSFARATLRVCRVVGRRVNANTCDLLSDASLARSSDIARQQGLLLVEELVATNVVPIRGLPASHQMSFATIDASRIPDAFAQWSRARPADPVDDDVDGLLAETLDWLEVAALRHESLVSVYWD